MCEDVFMKNDKKGLNGIEDIQPDEWYSRQEIAEVCQVTINTVANYIDIGIKTGSVARCYLESDPDRKGIKKILGSDLIDFLQKTGLPGHRKRDKE
jgi:hypothetical protein